MKVLSFCILHYGKEYLDVALQSVMPFSDKVIILYSPTPSQGYPTTDVCPDTREELKAICDKYPKVEWRDIHASYEGEHTNLIYRFTEGYDVLIRFDADEVFEPEDMPSCIDTVYNGTKRYYGMQGFYHFWKSFDYVCQDFFRPVRFEKLGVEGTETGELHFRIYHFSLCQDYGTIKYKWKIGGHHTELRPEWFEIFEKWRPEFMHLHPVSRDIWNVAHKFDKQTLPEFLKNHPNFNKQF